MIHYYWLQHFTFKVASAKPPDTPEACARLCGPGRIPAEGGQNTSCAPRARCPGGKAQPWPGPGVPPLLSKNTEIPAGGTSFVHICNNSANKNFDLVYKIS